MNAILLCRTPCVAVLAAGLLPLAVLHAQSGLSSQTLDFRLQDGSTAINFPAFDTSLGTLQSISLDFTATERYVMGVYQTGGSGNNHYSFRIDSSAFGVAGANSTVPASATLTGTSPGVYGGSDIDSLLGTAAGVFAGGGDPNFPGGAKLAGASGPVSGGMNLPLSFAGTVPLEFTSGTATEGFGGGNYRCETLVDLSGSATLTYEFTPIPEPAASAGLIGGAAIVFALLRRRRAAPANV